MAAKRLFAADLGASGGKCFVGEFREGGFTMHEVHRFAHDGVDFFLPDRGGALTPRTVWDDTFIYREILAGLQACRREVAASLEAISVDTWGADGALLSRDGDLLGKVYCYRDHRLDGMVERVKARIDARRLYQITGIHFQPFNLSNQLHWLVEERPALLQAGARFFPVPALFLHYLGGEHAVDSSWASVTQLMDAQARDWSTPVLEALGIPAAILPRIVAPGARVGTLSEPLARLTGLNAAPLLATAAHDTASAFAAAPVADPAGALIISSGTWSLVGKLVPEPITGDDAMAANISNEGGVGNIRFLKNVMGTWLAQELRRGWAVEDGREPSWKDLDALTIRAPAFAALVNPDDPSFYNPDDMAEAIRAYCRRTGQTPPSGRGAFLRTVYESLALKYRLVNEQICGVCGSRSQQVNIVGGGSLNVMLNQFTADALGLPVLAGPVEATAVGNFMVQAMGLGLLPSMQAAQPVIQAAFPIRRFEPGDRKPWDRAYETFRRLP
jgi:rhamnulokinase